MSVSVDDIKPYFSDANLKTLTSSDSQEQTSDINALISLSTSLVNDGLRGRYTLPIDNAVVDDLVRRITIYKIWERASTPNKHIIEDYNEAMRTLREYQNGIKVLPVGEGESNNPPDNIKIRQRYEPKINTNLML
jgi:phage gp36-like protein